MDKHISANEKRLLMNKGSVLRLTSFYLRDALLVRSLLSKRVCLSHASIVSKRIKISSNLFLGLVAPPLWSSSTTYGCEILTGRGACHSGGLRLFSV